MKSKIGVAIITCNRLHFFQKCISSFPKPDKTIIINDGAKIDLSFFPSHVDEIVQHKKNLGIAKSKNEGIIYLLNNGCEHIFLSEDDIAIKREDVFDHYIYTAQSTGIFHLNFAFHGNGNLDNEGHPVSRKILFKDGIENLSLNKNLVGAFTYYHKTILEKFGLIDERYMNGLEHVDHTLQIIKNGYHPPFWWFADAPRSYDYILDQDLTLSESIIRRKKFIWKYRMFNNLRYFKKKNGISPFLIPDSDEEQVMKELDLIQDKYCSGKILIRK